MHIKFYSIVWEVDENQYIQDYTFTHRGAIKTVYKCFKKHPFINELKIIECYFNNLNRNTPRFIETFKRPKE